VNKDVFPVAELNLLSAGSGKFSWDLKSTEVAQISRKHHSDPPDFHLHLGGKGDDTVPLTSTPEIVDPINVPLPDSPGISWESQNSLKSSSKLEVIDKQPSHLPIRQFQLTINCLIILTLHLLQMSHSIYMHCYLM